MKTLRFRGLRFEVLGFSSYYLTPVALCLFLVGCSQPATQATALNYGTTNGAGSAGVHTVLDGDSVYTISKAYRLPTRDIITLNDISPPYRLTVGYRVKLPPPREYTVQPRDNLRDIARTFDTTTSQIARLNNLRAPYSVRTGQVLRLPTPSLKVQQAVVRPSVEERTVTSAPVGRVEREVLSSGRVVTEPPQPSATTSSASSGSVAKPSVKPGMKPKVQQASTSTRAALPDKVPARSGNGKFMWPVDGKVISTYGPKADGLHNDGINIKVPKGTPVRAAENGVVVYAGNELEGYGNLVLIRHEDRWMTAYAHLDKFLIKKGETVRRGQSIGTVGSTGQVDSSQLHFEIRRGTEAKNPKLYL
ncbi:MAG: LysM peptidoglycan-binding domain-containing M23 family metallopeptidase [Pseudomonadota bacterium]